MSLAAPTRGTLAQRPAQAPLPDGRDNLEVKKRFLRELAPNDERLFSRPAVSTTYQTPLTL